MAGLRRGELADDRRLALDFFERPFGINRQFGLGVGPEIEHAPLPWDDHVSCRQNRVQRADFDPDIELGYPEWAPGKVTDRDLAALRVVPSKHQMGRQVQL